MSKFFKALEKAEREQVLRRHTWSWQSAPPEAEHRTSAAQNAAPPPGVSRPPAGPGTTTPNGIEPRLVTLLTPTTFEAEPYRILGHLVAQLRHETGLRVVAISSPGLGDGKTITAINLACVLAQEPGARVLLVEAELRRPSVGTYLGLRHRSGPGLVEAILDPTLSLESVVQQHASFHFHLLLAGRTLASPYDLLKLPRLGELLEQARQCYDCIIVDTPPMVPFADCRLIEKWLDGFLVVVAAHKTPRKLLEETLSVMDPAKIVGLVFNKDEHQTPGSYYYAYHYPPSANGHHKGRRPSWRRRTS